LTAYFINQWELFSSQSRFFNTHYYWSADMTNWVEQGVMGGVFTQGSAQGTVITLVGPLIAPDGQLRIRLMPGSVVLQWVDRSWFLQTAGEVAGAYTNLPGATSPYTNPTVNAAQFFRLIKN
jgi:hypothetical protein